MDKTNEPLDDLFCEWDIEPQARETVFAWLCASADAKELREQILQQFQFWAFKSGYCDACKRLSDNLRATKAIIGPNPPSLCKECFCNSYDGGGSGATLEELGAITLRQLGMPA